MNNLVNRVGVSLMVVLMMAACGGHSHHEHDHEGHEHEEYAHHNHEGHSRDDHSHEGHSHESHSHDVHDHKAVHDHETDEAHIHEGHAGEIIIAPDQARAAGIVAEELVRGPFRQVIPVSGEVLSAQGEEQTVVANVAGVVTFNRSLTEGVQVGKGTTLMTISSQNMADGNPAERARIAYEAARKEYERTTPLVESHIVSEKEYIRIKEAYENARLTYEALKADRPSEGGVRVESPMGGYLKNCLVKEGDYVSVGQPLLTVTRNNRLYLRADVPERHYAALPHIRSANFRTSYNNKVYTLEELDGRLLSYGRTAGEQSFYLPVTFEMNNRTELVPGSFAEIWLLSGEEKDVLSVPHTALTEEQGVHFVYVRLDEECYERREVTLGADNGREVQLLSGVHAGECVVMKGAYQVRLASVSKAIPGHSHEH